MKSATLNTGLSVFGLGWTLDLGPWTQGLGTTMSGIPRMVFTTKKTQNTDSAWPLPSPPSFCGLRVASWQNHWPKEIAFRKSSCPQKPRLPVPMAGRTQLWPMLAPISNPFLDWLLAVYRLHELCSRSCFKNGAPKAPNIHTRCEGLSQEVIPNTPQFGWSVEGRAVDMETELGLTGFNEWCPAGQRLYHSQVAKPQLPQLHAP